MFELDIDSISDDAHKPILNQRREELLAYVQNLDQIPAVPAECSFEQFTTYSCYLRKELTDLSNSLKYFCNRQAANAQSNDSTADRPINILIQAPPGAGKSTLVRSLAAKLKPDPQVYKGESFHVSKLIDVNCSNLLSYSDIIPIFERIALLHKNNIVPIVFFDEVDIPAWEVFQYMLMPMYDGAILAHGHLIQFGFAFFFFAASKQFVNTESTSPLTFHVSQTEQKWHSETQNQLRDFARSPKAQEKFPDFFSRIDFPISIPGLRVHFDEAFRNKGAGEIYWQDQEVLQMATAIIRRRFTRVSKIDARILAFLVGALPESKREIERLIFFSEVPLTETTFEWDHLPRKLIESGKWFKSVDAAPQKYIELKAPVILIPKLPEEDTTSAAEEDSEEEDITDEGSAAEDEGD